MLLLRPELVDAGYRDLPPARYPLLQPAPRRTTRCAATVRATWATRRAPTSRSRRRPSRCSWPRPRELAEGLLDGRLEARHLRSPFRLVPFLRTDFWPVAGALLAAGLGGSVAAAGPAAAPAARRSRRPGVRRSDAPSEKGAPPR